MHLVQDALVVGVRVDGVHQAVFDTEGIVEHLGGRCKAVSSAGSIRNDIVPGRIVHIFVNAKYNRDIFSFSGSRDNHFFCAATHVCCCLFGVGEQAGRFNHQFDT